MTFERVYGLVSIQDGGRPNLRKFGVPLGGAVDRDSAVEARALVRRPYLGSLFEFAQATADIRFASAVTIAWAGAAANLRINEVTVPLGRACRVPAGARLQVSGPYEGRYGYLAIAGEILADRWRGSVSPLRFGSSWRPSASIVGSGASVGVVPDEPSRITLRASRSPSTRVLSLRLWPAPETALFGDWIRGGPSLLARRLPRLSSMVWGSQPDGNRVGARLRHRSGAEVVAWLGLPVVASSPTLPGTVQVTPSGQLIVSLADGPTMGGYPRLGLVDAADLGRLAQGGAGVRFGFRQNGEPPRR